MRTADQNAVEFGRHEKFGGWALGLLVACSVEPDAGQGRRQPRNDRSEVKISATEFARRSGTSHPRVLRYYEAWERAADKRIVPRASRLKPDDVDNYNLPEGYEWNDHYDGSSRGGNNVLPSVLERAERDPQYRKELVEGLGQVDPQALIDEGYKAVENGRLPAGGHGSMVNRELSEHRIEQAGHAAAEFLGVNEALEYLRGAAREIANAQYAKEKWGIDPVEERKALRNIDRMLTLYKEDRWNDADITFLESFGAKP